MAVVSDSALVRRHANRKAVVVAAKDSAMVLVAKAGRALSKPGIDRRVVFRDNKAGIFSYSTYPADQTKVVREAADGSKRIGRLVKDPKGCAASGPG